MNSILSEYFVIIESLNRELLLYKCDQNDLKVQFFKLIHHNKKLTYDLKESIQLRTCDEKKVQTLRQELKAALEYKTVLQESSSSQLNDEPSQEATSSNKNFEKRISEVQEHYTNGVKVLSDELSNANQEITSLREKCMQNAKELEQCQGELEETQKLIALKETSLSDFKRNIEVTERKCFESEAKLAGAEKEAQSLKKENSNLKRQNAELHESNCHLLGKVSELENKSSFFELKAKKHLLEAQGAVMEKKAMAFKENLALKFTESLKTSINDQIEQSVAKHKDDIKTVRKECSERVSHLMQEIQNLQQENSRKQSLYEKAIREKFAIESKLKMTSSTEAATVSHILFEEVCQKLSHSEKSKDEALLQIQSLELAYSELQQRCSKENKYLSAESGKSKDQMEQLKHQLNEVLQTKLSLSNEVAELNRKHSLVKKQFLILELEAKKEVTLLNQSSSKMKTAFEKKLQSVQDHYHQQMTDLRELVEHQNTINKKWKKALQDLMIESETKMKEMARYVAQLEAERFTH